MDAVTIHKFLSSVSLAEIDEMVEWLENSLAAYKTLRAVKAVHDTCPAKLSPPFISATDVEEQEQTGDRRMARGEMQELVTSYLATQGPAAPKVIGRALRIKNANVHSHLRKYQNVLYEKVGTAWRLCREAAPPVTQGAIDGMRSSTDGINSSC